MFCHRVSGSGLTKPSIVSLPLTAKRSWSPQPRNEGRFLPSPEVTTAPQAIERAQKEVIE